MREVPVRKDVWPRWKAVMFLAFYVLLAAITLVLLVSVFVHIPRHPPHGKAIDCMNDLKQIGVLLTLRRQKGEEIFTESGSRFLLQVAPDLADHDLDVFLCPLDMRYAALRESALVEMLRTDWRTAPCSYRGPDEWLLAQLRANPDPKTLRVVACDMGGPDGDEPHHEGVVVLYEDGRVDFLDWDEIEGADGDPVPVGPNSPDPRLRHLVP